MHGTSPGKRDDKPNSSPLASPHVTVTGLGTHNLRLFLGTKGRNCRQKGLAGEITDQNVIGGSGFHIVKEQRSSPLVGPSGYRPVWGRRVLESTLEASSPNTQVGGHCPLGRSTIPQQHPNLGSTTGWPCHPKPAPPTSRP